MRKHLFLTISFWEKNLFSGSFQWIKKYWKTTIYDHLRLCQSTPNFMATKRIIEREQMAKATGFCSQDLIFKALNVVQELHKESTYVNVQIN